MVRTLVCRVAIRSDHYDPFMILFLSTTRASSKVALPTLDILAVRHSLY